MANASTSVRPVPRSGHPVVRGIGVADIRDALVRGWQDFRATPTQLVFLSIIYPIVGFIAARAAWGGDLMPLLWPLASGFALVGPVGALGIYELSRRREQGFSVTWLNAFGVLRSPSIGAIVLLGVMLLVILLVWLLTARAIYRLTLGADAIASIADFARLLFRTREGWLLIVIGNGVGLLFAALVLTLTVVAFPMLLDRRVGPAMAVRTSVRAVLSNPVPMALWGLVVAALLVLGSLPLFAGLAVVMPVLGHATWHLYRKVVAR